MVCAMQTAFFGWRVVAGAFVLASFGWGLGFYGPPIYLHQVQAERGWSTVLVSTAVTVHFLLGAIVVASLPGLYKRFGLPAITRTGTLVLALGVLGWALAREPWQLLLATLFSGAGWVTMAAAAINAIIAPWFAVKRPAALAMAYNGASIGGVVFSPLWVAAIGWLGFPMAALVIGVVMVIVVWLLSGLVFAKTPQMMGQVADGEPMTAAVGAAMLSSRPLASRGLWHDLRFLTLAGGMALGLFAQIGLIAHLFSLLAPALGEQLSGLLMGASTAAAIGGRTLVGWLMPPGSDRRVIASASHVVQIAGSLALIFAGGHVVAPLIMGVLLFGAGIGNTTSLPPLIAQAEFDKADVARVVPLIVAIGQGFYAFAPAVFGAIRALTSDRATLVFVTAATLQVLAIVAFLSGRRAG